MTYPLIRPPDRHFPLVLTLVAGALVAALIIGGLLT
jgi:hypothetical protein